MPPEVSKHDRGRNLVIIIWVFGTLSLTVVGIKVWTRMKILHQSGIEDMFIFSGWARCCTQTHDAQVLSFINGSLLTACVSLGLGKHPSAVDLDKLPHLDKIYTVSLPFAILTLSLPPIAVAILLDRLIEPQRSQKWVLYSVPALQFIAAAVDIVLLFVQCSPPSILWNQEATRANCWKGQVIISYIYFFASYTAFTDVFLAFVPIVAFWRLQLRPKAKIILYVLMSSTMIAAACAFIRIAYISQLADPTDYTYSSVKHTMWAVLEGNAIIIATCIPGLRPFFKLLRRKYFARKRRHRPPPLILHKDLHPPSDASALSSPISPRRMEPRGCGSVSSAVPKGPNHKAYRQKSLAPILPNPNDVDGEEFEMKEGKDVEKQRLDSGHGAEEEVREASTAETSVETSGVDEKHSKEGP
ncbi:MAG: hypothetical protein Q9212_002848 [Teloschistes hypoglaucus]